MSRLYKTSLILLLFIIVTLSFGYSLAANNKLPTYYPTSFEQKGFLRGIGSGGKITISGIKYTLSPNALIHSLTTQHSSRFALKAGQEVGFSINSSNHQIIELWILPKGSLRDS